MKHRKPEAAKSLPKVAAGWKMPAALPLFATATEAISQLPQCDI
jgi:hypothetical protein